VKRAIVIGGGVGGLAASINMARAGIATTLFERGATVGGRLREVDVGGQKFLGGPSVLTMRHVFEELFDGKLAEHVTLLPLDPLCRHFFADGSELDLFTDTERTRAAIARFAGPRDADGYMSFRKQAAKIYEIVRGPFMERPLPSLFDFMNPRAMWQMTQIDGMRTLVKALESFFRDRRLQQLFARYATYNGSSPYHAPATLAVIAHVENAFGIFAVKGGLYRLAEALAARAKALGVEIVTNADVESIVLEPAGGPLATSSRARGVRVGGEVSWADCVIANCDVADAYERLLSDMAPIRKLARQYEAEELSLSAYVLLSVADKSPLTLAHHNVFFSRDYPAEFESLVRARRPPDEPTVYLCAEDRAPDATPGERERCFLLTNAPPLDGKGRHVDWSAEAKACRERIENTLSRHNWKLVSHHIGEITPPDFAARFPSSKGAIYGLASNSKMAAFKRPANKIPEIENLYFCGGSVHPGAGLPMVALSAKIATQLALGKTA
jgi:1-hydroxycarotenoid 3,4-desaturase